MADKNKAARYEDSLRAHLRVANGGDPVVIDIPASSELLQRHLSYTRKGIVRLGSPWASRLKIVARLTLFAALATLFLVALARWFDVGWTPRYVTLIALGFGALLLLSTLGARPRNPQPTGIKMTEAGIEVRTRNAPAEAEVIPPASIREAWLEGYCNHHIERDGDIAAAREKQQKNLKRLEERVHSFSSCDPKSDHEFSVLADDIELEELVSLGVVAKLEDGRELVLGSQPVGAPIERLLGLLAIILDAVPQVSRQVRLVHGNLIKLPINESGDILHSGAWQFRSSCDRGFAVCLLLAVLFSTTSWLAGGINIGQYGLETPGWLRGLYESAPFLVAVVPITMSILSYFVEPPTLRMDVQRDPEEAGGVRELLALLTLSGVALYAYIGLRDVALGVPVWAQITSGVVFVLCLMLRTLRRWLFGLMTGLIEGFRSLLRTLTDAGESRFIPDRFRPWWTEAVGMIGVLVLSALGLLFLIGLGKLSGMLMGVEPTGRGGKTAIPLYFDLIVVSLILAWLPVSAKLGTLRWTLLASAFMIFIAWLVLSVGVPGMSQLNPMATVFYLTLNALIAQHFFR